MHPPSSTVDLDVSFLHHQLEDIDEDGIEDGPLMAGTAMAVMVHGAEEVHRLRTERRVISALIGKIKTKILSRVLTPLKPLTELINVF